MSSDCLALSQIHNLKAQGDTPNIYFGGGSATAFLPDRQGEVAGPGGGRGFLRQRELSKSGHQLTEPAVAFRFLPGRPWEKKLRRFGGRRGSSGSLRHQRDKARGALKSLAEVAEGVGDPFSWTLDDVGRGR